MTPKYGPSVWKVARLSDQVVAPAGGVLGPVSFYFPRSVFVDSILILPTTGLRTDMAKLSVRIEDETSADIIADGQGGHEASLLSVFGTTLLVGPMFDDLVLKRPFAVQRPVLSGDEWLFTITNDDPLLELQVEALIYFKEGEMPA
jgi:hypothetical protein